MLNYTVPIKQPNFESNRLVMKAWMIEHNLLHLWLATKRLNFFDYIVYFDKEEDAVAFRLRFGG